MKLEEFLEKPVGTKIYKVLGGYVQPYFILINPTGSHLGHYFYLVNGGKVSDAFGVYLPNDNDFWTDNYDDAKEEMWKQTLKQLESKNRIYFNGLKKSK